MNNFTQFNLDSNICKAIAACGYTQPTPVQAKSIPEVLQGKDVVVSAQTGTGKTAAFVLPSLHNLSLQEATKKTRVLILTPTRELASQITKAAALYGKFMRFNIVSLVGGMPYHGQIKDLGRGADIIVATPGRLMDHMEQKRVDLSHVDMLVLDEADRMLDMGFIEDVQYIAKLTPSKRQTLLFSATLDNKLMKAVKHLLKDPVRIDLSSEKIASPQIQQEMYRASNLHHKTRLLKHFLSDENIYKAIIFSATKINADKLADQLCDDGFAAAALHGDLRQNVRNRTLEKLRTGKIQYLVATDVAARGIDISDITHVFNFDLPRFCEDYVHRIGRTGRAGKTGIAISFVLPTEMHHLKSIERYTGQRIQLLQHEEVPGAAPARKSRDEQFEESDRPARKFRSDRSERFEKPFKSDRSDKPARKFKSDRSDRFEKDFKSDRSDKPERKFKSDRNDRFEKDFKSDRSDRPERKFKSDRNDRFEKDFKSNRSDKPARKFKSDRNDRFEKDFKSDRSDKPARKFKSDRNDRFEKDFKSDRSDKPARKFKSDRSDRFEKDFKSDRSDKPARKFKSDRNDRFEKSDRGEKSERKFKSSGKEKFGKSFQSEKNKSAQDDFKKEGYRTKSKEASSKISWKSKGKSRAKPAGKFEERREKGARTENRSFKKKPGKKY
jgi:superfamily II DNA/RNA helicase